jgi:hypothetical protein
MLLPGSGTIQACLIGASFARFGAGGEIVCRAETDRGSRKPDECCSKNAAISILAGHRRP